MYKCLCLDGREETTKLNQKHELLAHTFVVQDYSAEQDCRHGLYLEENQCWVCLSSLFFGN